MRAMRYLLLIVAFTASAFAESPSTKTPVVVGDEKKDVMDVLDVAQFDAAVAHLAVIDRDSNAQKKEIDKNADVMRKPFVETFLRICKKYNINPAQLGSAVNVDTSTGVIVRKLSIDDKTPAHFSSKSAAVKAPKK